MHLNHFYQDPMTYAEAHLIWFIHYLVLMAFGKAFVTQTRRGSEPPGLQLFERALRLLPDVTFLINERVESTETLCCIALYLESVDHRTAAHVYIGQAVRMALSHGLHNELQASAVGDQLARRGRRIWWTVYTLDRKLSSSMGVPNCLRDEDISASLAVEQEADAEISGLVLHVRISQLLGNVISTVYSTDGKLRDTCIPTAQTVLRGVAGLVDELAAFSSRCFGDVSRVSARLNLAYHQCIILTTRPFLYHLLQQRLGNLEPWSTLAASSPMKGLVQISIDSCIQTMMILSQLQDHDLLDTFLPFDLESAFSAAFALSMVSSVHPKLLPDYGWFDTAMSVFDTMAMKGNLLADVRKSEVEELAHVLRGSSGGDWTSASSNIFLNAQQGTYNPLSGKSNLSALGDPFFDAWNIDEGFSGTQIMDLADALDLGEMNHT
ncbi:hypothetical protein EKO04_007231 [Ascochyta lentis]|uniref:Xylanolytic transcriptional activator regulatory domain-containing protein n=1 Tax=Ascochyta lentis TaxID=205686 RepID=A0A8H7J0S3_9PLEO|nr:hypothetical protein EKO04_007231 [Ascochyta lentis]